MMVRGRIRDWRRRRVGRRIFTAFRYEDVVGQMRRSGSSDGYIAQWWANTARGWRQMKLGAFVDPRVDEFESRLRGAGLGEADIAVWWFKPSSIDGKPPIELLDARDYEQVSRAIDTTP